MTVAKRVDIWSAQCTELSGTGVHWNPLRLAFPQCLVLYSSERYLPMRKLARGGDAYYSSGSTLTLGTLGGLQR